MPKLMVGLMLWALCLMPIQAREVLEVIPLQHRLASDLIPVLTPLLGPQEVISGRDFQLLIRAHPATISALRESIAALDRPARNLLLVVRRGSRPHTQNPPWQEGQPVTRQYHTRRDGETHQLRVLEGQAALIKTGESLAAPMLMPWQEANHAGSRDVFERGFGVRPLLLPDGRILLEVEQFYEKLRPESSRFTRLAERQALSTTITARPDEWISLGTAVRHEDLTSGERRLGSSTHDPRESMAVDLKVQVLD